MPTFPRVAAYAPPGAVGLGLGLTSAIFRARPGLTAFEFDVCAARPGPLATDLGVPVLVEHGPELLAAADLILLLPGASFAEPPPDEVISGLRAAHERGATLAAHCLGVFLLAATGLLDDLEVTTHWQYAEQLTAAYPRVRVRPDALYLDHGNIVTGAGAAAGIDMCLHLIRRDHGGALANSIARILVTPPHREGGQQQFITAPLAAGGDGDRLAKVIAWARSNLDQELSLDELASRALMSRRSFVRHFKAATGSTPHAWLLSQRISHAEELLETTSLPIEQIAGKVGYHNAAVFRQQFTARRGIPPRDYRRTFTRTALPPCSADILTSFVPDTREQPAACQRLVTGCRGSPVSLDDDENLAGAGDFKAMQTGWANRRRGGIPGGLLTRYGDPATGLDLLPVGADDPPLAGDARRDAGDVHLKLGTPRPGGIPHPRPGIRFRVESCDCGCPPVPRGYAVLCMVQYSWPPPGGGHGDQDEGSCGKAPPPMAARKGRPAEHRVQQPASSERIRLFC